MFPSEQQKGKATSPKRIGSLRIRVWDVGGKREGVPIDLTTLTHLIYTCSPSPDFSVPYLILQYMYSAKRC